MEEALLPELDKKVFKTIRQVQDSRPQSEAEKRAEAITSLEGYGGWEEGLKPYIQVRIEGLKTMAEVQFDGKETVEEIGLRAIICSVVSNELQDLLNWVEVNTKVFKDKQKKEKEKKERKKVRKNAL